MNTYITKQINYTKLFAIMTMAALFITSLTIISKPQQVGALSCMQSFPLIAIVDDIETGPGGYTNIITTDHFLLDSQIFESKNITNPLYHQMDIIKSYLNNELPEYNDNSYSGQDLSHQIHLEHNITSLVRLGDIVIKTPPSSKDACGGPGLTSIFRLRNSQDQPAKIITSYFAAQPYGEINLGGALLYAKPHPNDLAQVNISFGGETFSLRDGESKETYVSNPFYSIEHVGIVYHNNEVGIWGGQPSVSLYAIYGEALDIAIDPEPYMSGPRTVDKCQINYSQLVRYGRRGNDVRQVQSCLNNLGYNTGTADGIYGPNTYRGVTEFQRSIGGIQVDGIVGPVTVQYLNQL